VTKKRRGGESIELRWSPGREEEEDGNSTENGELQQEFSSIIMSSTSHGVYLEGSGGHGRTSLSSGGEPQVAPASLSDDKGDDEGAGVAGSTQMETDPPNVAPMDEALWGTLPEDLQDRILAWLPFPAFARACTVCKRYNLTYTSLHSSIVVAGPLFCLCMIATRLGRGSRLHLQSSTFSYGCRNIPISSLISS
jgi:hypothetical protein